MGPASTLSQGLQRCHSQHSRRSRRRHPRLHPLSCLGCDTHTMYSTLGVLLFLSDLWVQMCYRSDAMMARFQAFFPPTEAAAVAAVRDAKAPPGLADDDIRVRSYSGLPSIMPSEHTLRSLQYGCLAPILMPQCPLSVND